MRSGRVGECFNTYLMLLMSGFIVSEREVLEMFYDSKGVCRAFVGQLNVVHSDHIMM